MIVIIYIIAVTSFCGLMELNSWLLDREARLIMSGEKLPWGG